MVIDDLMDSTITLHGLGFIQVQLPERFRIHVWHPELPRRSCFQHSAIHDHRFSFVSRVLIGEQINYEFAHENDENGEFDTYIHEGARLPCGGRPWVLDGRIRLESTKIQSIKAGGSYTQSMGVYHKTVPGGDGRVATLMCKLREGKKGAHSTCRVGIQPDTEFDRFQWSPSRLKEVMADVLCSHKVTK